MFSVTQKTFSIKRMKGGTNGLRKSKFGMGKVVSEKSFPETCGK